MGKQQFLFTHHPGEYGVCRLEPRSPIPAWAYSGPFYSHTRTPAELSIICSAENIPPEVTAEKGWSLLEINAEMDFSVTGVVSSIAGIFADAEISVFVFSTFNTDFFLVKREVAGQAVALLRANGHNVEARSHGQ